ncbi:MAG: DNA-protecting protein DprA [Anaerolineales bacterium]|nr:DNA-protecting protein DprA [Anaerolineales bacterium]
MKNNTKYWVGFNLVKGIGPVRLETLLQYFGDIQAAWEARSYHLQAAGLNDNLVKRISEIRNRVSLDELEQKLRTQGIQVLTWDDPAYPDRLRQIVQSPFVLYIKGQLLAEDAWAVAIVGTRRYSSYGRQVAENISNTLARNGITIISGLARGIDGIAHRAAIEAGGRTIAVLGSGLDILYPPEHRALAEEISKSGALISDYSLGTPPDGSNFPPRNRIISGLSKIVIVIEAGERSGALITATYAAEQGKEVFAVPGKISAPMSKGTNLLIKQGAHPLLDPQDVLDLLNMTLVAEQRVIRKALPSDPKEAVLYQAVGEEPLHVDEICSQVNLPIEEVTSTLALMELKGMVRKTFGMKYVAVQELNAGYHINLNQDREGR